jgi:hypothetical protein
MAQANPNNSTTALVVPSRRRFLSQAAGLAAGGTALALATVTPTPAAADDSALLKLEEQIFEQHEAAHAFDDEIDRTLAIWTAEGIRLEREALKEQLAGRPTLTSKERWELVRAMPESKEREGIQFIDSSRPPPARDNLPSTALVSLRWGRHLKKRKTPPAR